MNRHDVKTAEFHSRPLTIKEILLAQKIQQRSDLEAVTTIMAGRLGRPVDDVIDTEADDFKVLAHRFADHMNRIVKTDAMIKTVIADILRREPAP